MVAGQQIILGGKIKLVQQGIIVVRWGNRMKTILNIIIVKNDKEKQQVQQILQNELDGVVMNKHTIIMPKKLMDEFLTEAGRNWFKIMGKQK
jgi:hypothetical protein